MSACYSCHAILNRKNQSIEHILPNSIGGILKSYRLLCRQCNSAYGMTIDAALAKRFEALAGQLNIRHDRTNHHNSKHADKLIIRMDGAQLYISGNGNQVMQLATGLKRKFPYIDTDPIEKTFTDDTTASEQNITTHLFVGNDLLLRSVAKIAVNYYLMKTRGRHYLDEIINVIDGIEKNNYHIHEYPLPDNILNNDNPSHLIIIKGSTLLKQLYAHVVLFNTHSFVVLLSDVYDGEDVEYFYRYDVIAGIEIKNSITLAYDRQAYLKK